MPRVVTDITDHIAHVHLNRPEKMNAVDPDMIGAIIEAGQKLTDAPVRAVVLSGEGKSFCAGLDIASFDQLASTDPQTLLMPRSHGNTNKFQELVMVWRRLQVPVIAALHGAVYGAGFQLALGADIRIAAPDTKLAAMEMKWGLIPDMGGMALLPHLTRDDVIRYLTYTAHPVKTTQAEHWGLVTELHDVPVTRALELAESIAQKSPSAIQAAKRLITYAQSGANQNDILLAESREQAGLIGKPDQMEMISANMAGRKPCFE